MVSANKSPLDKGKKNIREVFEENKESLLGLTFLATCTINCKPNDYILPKQNKFLYQNWNRTFLVWVKKTGINISLKANFVIEDVKECEKIYNDKSSRKNSKYYLVTLKNHRDCIEKDVEIANNSKSDYKQFQTDINNRYNDFAINMSESEFKTFIAEFVSPKVASKAFIYTNAGLLAEGKFLYENALATKNKIIWADESGYIKLGENTFIKVAEASHYLPKLSKSTKTGKEIAKNLIENLLECWPNDIILPMITLGHMVMSLFYDEFIKRYGVPTLILFGETGTGKSTLVTVGLAIFGMTREALSSGGSTAKSNEFFASKYNGMNICIDDVKGQTLVSSNFTALVKGAYKGIPRNRLRSFGQEVDYIHICSPLAYSTNDTLPDLKEVVNRLNIVEIFGKGFEADKFEYHEINNSSCNNLKELSLILPELLKHSIKDIIEIYDTTFTLLENNIEDTQKRIVNNLAYAYTGALLLLNISGVVIPNFEDMLINYAKKQAFKYENIKNVVDKVLAEIPVLNELRIIDNGTHFRLAVETYNDKEELHLRFHKGVILSIINKYYSHDKSKQINEALFSSYVKSHPRFRGNKPVRYNANDKKPANSVCFNVTGLEEYAEFEERAMPTIKPMSAEELRNNIKCNNR